MMRMRTGTPLCRPMPEHSTAARIVCSNLNKALVTCDSFSGYRQWEEIGCGIFTTVRVSGKTPVAAPYCGPLFYFMFLFHVARVRAFLLVLPSSRQGALGG
jgi:hypothetical protein